MRVDAGQYPGDICWHGQRRRRARRGKGGHSQLALILNLEDLLAASGRVCDVELQTDVRAQGERKGSTRVDGDGWRPNTQTDTPSISARAHSPTLANRRLRITAARSDPSQLPAQQIKRARGSTLHEKLEWRSRAEARSFTSKDPHRQPSTPRARVLASGPCRVRCNRMPVAIRNEQLRPVSEPPRHRLARSQAAQRSVARRRRMLPAIVRAHPCSHARPVSDWPSARDTAAAQFYRLETPLCPSRPSLPPAARTFIASASHRRMSKLCALVLHCNLFFTDFVCFCGERRVKKPPAFLS